MPHVSLKDGTSIAGDQGGSCQQTVGRNTAPPWVHVLGAVCLHELMACFCQVCGTPTERAACLMLGLKLWVPINHLCVTSAGPHDWPPLCVCTHMYTFQGSGPGSPEHTMYVCEEGNVDGHLQKQNSVHWLQKG